MEHDLSLDSLLYVYPEVTEVGLPRYRIFITVLVYISSTRLSQYFWVPFFVDDDDSLLTSSEGYPLLKKNKPRNF